MRYLVAEVACGSLILLAAVRVRAVTMQECGRWMEKVRTAAVEAQISGDESDNDRWALLQSVNRARARAAQPDRKEAVEMLRSFQDRADALAADGKVTRFEGVRLHNISEGARQCLERVEEEK